LKRESRSCVAPLRAWLHLAFPASPRGSANILPRDWAGIMLMGSFSTMPDGSERVCTWHRALGILCIANGLG
jgi:hypothetical protein